MLGVLPLNPKTWNAKKAFQEIKQNSKTLYVFVPNHLCVPQPCCCGTGYEIWLISNNAFHAHRFRFTVLLNFNSAAVGLFLSRANSYKTDIEIRKHIEERVVLSIQGPGAFYKIC